jgi:hypothetical protein
MAICRLLCRIYFREVRATALTLHRTIQQALERPLESTGNANLPVNSRRVTHTEGSNEANSSGVSWSAVLAGSFVTAALSLILLALGTGLGFASVSVWSGGGASAATIGTAAILWFVLIQIISASMGGYLAGRLRTKWTGIHTDEVYFRDTAHGFLAWSVSLVVTAAFLTAAATSLMGSAPDKTSAGIPPQGQVSEASPNAYFIDSLFRTDGSKPDVENALITREVAIIFATALKQGDLTATDKNYLDKLIASRAGVSESEANKRVNEAFLNAKTAAEAARKAIAHSLL